jgi:hypothetical protein
VASYKYQRYIACSSSDEFDRDHQPGQVAPFSGIYLCVVCGRETAINHDELLPSQNHHERAPGQGAIRWRLIVYASHQPD